MAAKRRRVFDEAYYDRFYRATDTPVWTDEEMATLGNFVCAYLVHLGVRVGQVLDLGCGLGPWRAVITRHYPDASYTGVEISDYLCRKYGWQRGSVVDYRSRKKFDLVICQGVLQYLDEHEAKTAIANLGQLCHGALFLEVLTREDWERHVDRSATDEQCNVRDAAWYAARLRRHFTNCGGGVFLSKRFEHYVYALDRLD